MKSIPDNSLNATLDRPLSYTVSNSPDQEVFKQPHQLERLLRFGERSAADLFLSAKTAAPYSAHLEAAVQWLKRCHDHSPDAGISWGYSLKGGWRDSYRETSGYIVNTLFDLAQRQDADARERAITISHWLVSIQEKDGSIANTRYGSEGIVFDTGQVLQGFIRAYEETQDAVFLQAANAAGDWLVEVADQAGIWSNNTHNKIPHVYNARVAWKLLKLNQIAPNPERERVARANLDWAVSQQRENGLFDQCAFVPGAAPFVHTVAYAIRGLLEAGRLLDEPAYIESAIAGARAVQQQVQADGFIPGQVAVDGAAVGRYSCLTGNCQMAIIWLRLFEQTQDTSFYDVAAQTMRYVMGAQDIKSSDLNVRGAIKGSQPIWGPYARLSYPNWATKFFIDAMLLLTVVESQKL